ncbi:MAG: aromatic ring-hydroxylating dioxygenase subunit alpha [Mesorhizobium sp.]
MIADHHHPSPLLDRCPESLPAHAYFDAQWYEQEQRTIWTNNWVYVGRLNDHPLATMRRLTLAGANVILCRDKAGALTAFHNTCRHRGAELCSQDAAPMGALIRCPYHAWAYSTSGELVSTAYATPTPDFDRREYGLLPVWVKTWNGFIYLCLADREPEFSIPSLYNRLDNWPLADLVTGHRLVKNLACNWKLFWENYNECLHCPGIHPELCDMVPIYKKGIMSPQESPDWVQDMEHGPSLKPGASTWTQSGKPCGPEFPDLTAEERAAGYVFVTHYPTMYVVGHVDYVRCVSLKPTGPETTQLTAEWMFPAETLAQPGFRAAEVARFATTVLLQDGEATELNQRGLKSPKFKRGRLMPQEFEIHRFHQWVARQMKEEGAGGMAMGRKTEGRDQCLARQVDQ